MLPGSLVGPGFLRDVWSAETLECPRGDVTGDPRCEQRPGGTCPRDSLRDAEESELRPQDGGLGGSPERGEGSPGSQPGRVPPGTCVPGPARVLAGETWEVPGAASLA